MTQRDKNSFGSPPDWLDHAESDLKMARIAVETPGIRKEHGCFHAQQAAEKAIKAVLLSRGVEFPLTHDIEELLTLAEKNSIRVPSEVQKAGLLTPFAVETRYPGFWTDIQTAEIEEALLTAEHTVLWAKSTVPQKKYS